MAVGTNTGFRLVNYVLTCWVCATTPDAQDHPPLREVMIIRKI